MNHYAMFGNRHKYYFLGDKYKDGAEMITRKLLVKYGS